VSFSISLSLLPSLSVPLSPSLFPCPSLALCTGVYGDDDIHQTHVCLCVSLSLSLSPSLPRSLFLTLSLSLAVPIFISSLFLPLSFSCSLSVQGYIVMMIYIEIMFLIAGASCTHISVLQCVAVISVCCSVLQRVAVCVAVCCSV